ncbi:hypothetical protein M427DRAFT_450463 [Gonapodya prolifera JEL478]|uniref:sn-1-specific diacylglycerol lipase n=1 Tax=Gonapodya prolifera (strain JEL478) TaxID=1344416 RepID=A0A139ART7_GONPJ|nr:hypothetical protein M427DRAFT_450463 [Gonapodya prolifera JEL478]|eukprot:KXS19429.1 hypothetical protein M427DRAFT_450463 [Gonapodya prolifera JEL478]
METADGTAASTSRGMAEFSSPGGPRRRDTLMQSLTSQSATAVSIAIQETPNGDEVAQEVGLFSAAGRKVEVPPAAEAATHVGPLATHLTPIHSLNGSPLPLPTSSRPSSSHVSGTVEEVTATPFEPYLKNWTVTILRFFHGYLYLVAFTLVIAIGINFQLSVFFSVFSSASIASNYAGVMSRLSFALLFGVVVSIVAVIIWRHFVMAVRGLSNITLRKTPAAVDDYLRKSDEDAKAKAGKASSAVEPFIPLWLQTFLDLLVQILAAVALDFFPIVMAVVYNRSTAYDFVSAWLQWAIISAIVLSLFYTLAELTATLTQLSVNLATVIVRTRGLPLPARLRYLFTRSNFQVRTLNAFVEHRGFRLLRTGRTYITERSSRLWLSFRFIAGFTYYVGWLILASSLFLFVDFILFVRAIVLSSSSTSDDVNATDLPALPTAVAPTLLYFVCVAHAWIWIRPWGKILDHYRKTHIQSDRAREVTEAKPSDSMAPRSPEPPELLEAINRAIFEEGAIQAPRNTVTLTSHRDAQTDRDVLKSSKDVEALVPYVMFKGLRNSWISGLFIGLLFLNAIVMVIGLAKEDRSFLLVVCLLFFIPYFLSLAAFSYIVRPASLAAAEAAGVFDGPLRRFYRFNHAVSVTFYAVIPAIVLVLGLVWYVVTNGSTGSKVGTGALAVLYIALAIALLIFLTNVQGFPTTVFLSVYGLLFLVFLLIFITAATFTSGAAPQEAYAGFNTSWQVTPVLVRPGDLSFGAVAKYPTGPPAVCGVNVGNLSVIDFALMSTIAYDNRENVSLDLATWMGGDWKVNHYNTNPLLNFYEFYSPSRNLSVVAVRGTNSLTDVLTDMDLWSESAIFQTADFFVPTVRVWPVGFTQKLVDLASMTSWLNISEFKFKNLTDHVQSVLRNRSGDQVVLTGHSLGGGLASIVAAEAGLRSVVFSPPGILYSSKKFGIEASPDTMAQTLTSIVVDRDVVSKVDSVPGTIHHITCDESPVTCHSLTRTTALLQSWCGDTGRYALLSGYCDYVERFGGAKCPKDIRRT